MEKIRDGFLRMCDPSYLCSKTFYMILLPLEDILRNEHWERTVLDTYTLDVFVEPLLDLFPNKERGRLSIFSWQDALLERAERTFRM